MSMYIPSWTSWRTTIFVYIMESGDLRKIGATIDPYRRLVEVQRDIRNAVKLEFLASHPVRYLYKIEAAVHQQLSDKRVRGEWFSVTYHEAESAIVRCLIRETNIPSCEDIASNYNSVRDGIALKSEHDLEALQEINLESVVLNGPPTGMTATQRLCALLDWRYGQLSSQEVAQEHRVSKHTMFRCFGDRVVYGKAKRLKAVTDSDLKRIFWPWRE